MTKKVSKAATIALGVGLISEGSKIISGGNWREGGLMIAVGILVVYGYEVLQEHQVAEVVLEAITEQGEDESNEGE